jgi:hypothetical protein
MILPFIVPKSPSMKVSTNLAMTEAARTEGDCTI